MKSGRSGAHKPGKLGFSHKANKGNDTGTGGLGVLPTHEISRIEMTTEVRDQHFLLPKNEAKFKVTTFCVIGLQSVNV